MTALNIHQTPGHKALELSLLTFASLVAYSIHHCVAGGPSYQSPEGIRALSDTLLHPRQPKSSSST